ncbi:hypothetical protein M3Y94_00785400 [Aphelenchoides besseyi]|nr:hypothetical protein M3Y94_00785400 [Aphelenchoides besseyi]
MISVRLSTQRSMYQSEQNLLTSNCLPIRLAIFTMIFAHVCGSTTWCCI